MTIYQSIKTFGKKALLVGGLVSILYGCNTPPKEINNTSYRMENDGLFDTVAGGVDKDFRILSGPDSELKRLISESVDNPMRLYLDRYPIIKYKKR